MPGRRRPSRPLVDAAAPASARPAARPREANYIVRASELGSYAYCHRAWWLRYVAHAEPGSAGRARLEAGTDRHAAHGRAVWLAGWLWRAGLVCAGLAGLSALLWLAFTLLAH